MSGRMCWQRCMTTMRRRTTRTFPEYLTVLSPYLAGLPYDFDQVRVFTWNVKMHRYETAFREKNIEGYLPVVIGNEKDPYGKSPLALTSAADLYL